jgi:dipeptidyl aminopeptidase/acylaminoacyl peptidase
MPVRFWNAWLEDKKPHVFTQELTENAQAADVLKGSRLADSAGFGGIFNGTAGGQTLHAVWSPDGQSIIFAAAVNRNEMMFAPVYTALFSVSSTGGEPVQLTPAGDSFSQPRFPPSGNALFALHQRRGAKDGRLYSLTRLARVPWPERGSAEILTEEWDRSVSDYSFSADTRTIYVQAEDDGFDQLFRLPANGGTVQRLFRVERGGYTAVQPSAGGLLALFQTAVQPPEVVRLNPEAGSHSMLTNFNGESVARIDAPPPIHFRINGRNGKRIHNILFLPPQFDEKKKYPLVLFPHGGPASMSKDAFSARWNSYLLTSPGYVVLSTNYTGSTGFGEKFADDIEKDVLRGPASELLQAVEEAVRRYPFIDATRQAAAGASYGGYLVNWLNGHTKQFKCLIAHAGAVNNESQYGVNDGGIERELRMGGPIWEKAGQWNDQSPLRYAGAFSTPTLLTQGELDFRVPLNETMTTFKILQRRQIPSRLVVFPDEGHWILKGENSRLHMQEVLGWLKRYL